MKMGKSRGYSLVEVLAALAIAGVAITLLAKGTFLVDQQSKRDRIISTMVALENSLTAAINDSQHLLKTSRIGSGCRPGLPAAQYPVCLRNTLEDFKTGTATQPPLEIFDVSSPNLITSKVGTPIFFDADGNSCTGTKCDIKNETFLRVQNSVVWIGYRISHNSKLEKAGETKIASLGLPDSFDPTNPTDPIFSTDPTLAQNFYTSFRGLPKVLSTRPLSDQLTCKTFLKGFDPLTGKAICWEDFLVPTACPVGTLLTGYQANGGTLAPVCTTFRSMSCDANGYALLSFDPQSLFPPPGKVLIPPTCVYSRATFFNYITNKSIAGHGSCPNNYSPFPATPKTGPWRCKLILPEKVQGRICSGACS
jgi:prepilin-type N-terminal cleavage/methylation domain-containing protein